MSSIEFLHTKWNVNEDEVVVVMPVDVESDEGFLLLLGSLRLNLNHRQQI